jgi:broad specificity phosphatase PhoE
MIIFVRHGEAAAGWGHHRDPGLSETGRLQAQAVAETLIKEAPECLLSSPMLRCRETAAPLARLTGLDVTIDPDVSEIPTPSDVSDRVDWLRQLMSRQWADAPELVLGWHRRLLARLSTLPERTIVFSHFVAINAIVGDLEASPDVMVFRPDYCSLTWLQQTPGGLALMSRGAEAGTAIL